MCTRVTIKLRSMVCLSLFVFAGCASEPSTTTPASPERVDRIEIRPNPPFFRVGESTQLTAVVYSMSNRVMQGQTVRWTTSDSSIASIDEAGVVHGVHRGNAIITASVADRSSTLSLLVQPGDCARSEGAIAIGETRRGILDSATACALSGEPAASWQLTVTAPTSVQIVLTSYLYFTHVVLTDAELRPLGEARNSAQGVLLRGVLDPGSYIVWVMADGDDGHYELSVKVQ
jgi:hypothetical protein